ncbi:MULTISPECIES: hypothetical protein [unclassified Methylobacterium]|uniref:hypothetical protein n=1 Tax=unclassified Methylobacterium TaxID=2615210 RepID=UPI0005BB7A8A|nr:MULTISPECIES: hypothetical protein [unclassified Methylobacterium]SFU37161.1 hypothetical protein SAMN02799643_00368 [Methylobacterium sp. UNCCL125]
MRVLVALLLACGPALAAGPTSTPPNLSAYATQGALSAVQAQIPQPATAAPPMEQPGGAPGSALTFRRGDAVQPRITRSKTVTLDASGTATFDWTAQGALSAPVQVVLGPVYAGTGIPKCWITASSATAASIKCVIEQGGNLTLSALTAAATLGLNLNATSASGMQVGIVVLPSS